MKEQHSLQSLSARLGLSRAAALGALSSRKLGRVESERIGQRVIYRITTEAIDSYKSGIRAKLESRISKLTSDPIRRQEMTGSALAALRDDAQKEQELWSASRLAERLGISLEGASHLLGLYAERVPGGFKISADAMSKITKHVEETRGGALIVRGGVVS